VVLTGAAVGASVTLRQIRETATASRNQLKLSEQGQFTDRYTKAIDQLDNKKALAVRLGGLYALERIARDSPPDRATIAEVLCTYARSAPPRSRPPGDGHWSADYHCGRGRDADRQSSVPDGTCPRRASRADHP
jgi:hypothetical protein